MCLNVPLSVQEDDHSCGQHCVSMVTDYHGVRIPPESPVFADLCRSDGCLDSPGVACSLAELVTDGHVLFASDSMAQIVHPDGSITRPPADARARFSRLRRSKRVFLMEWCRFEEEAVGDGKAVARRPTNAQSAERFPHAYSLMNVLVELEKLPCIIAVDYRLIQPSCSLLHYLVVTSVKETAIKANNPGPRPHQRKNQRIPRSTLETAWARADNDLIAFFPDREKFTGFLLKLLGHVLNFHQGSDVTWIGDLFWESVVKTLRNNDEAIDLIENRLYLMMMQAGPTAVLLRQVLERMEQSEGPVNDDN